MTDPFPKRQRTALDATEIDPDSGFIIKCSDNESFRVTPQMSLHLQAACDYFRTVFRHNTIETETRVINKPDWTCDTVQLLLTLILKGTVSVSDLSELVAVTSAADQVLLEYNMYSPFDQGQILSEEIKDLFLDLADPSKEVFSFQGPERILQEWKTWLQKGLFHSVDWKMFIVSRRNNPNDLRYNEMGRNFYYVHHTDYTQWQVHAYNAVNAVQHVCHALKRVTIEPEEEEFYKLGILYPHADITDDLAVTIAQETGGRSFSATFWDEVSTLCGPFSMLNNGFKVMRRCFKHNKVILRVKTQSPIAVARIIKACCFHCNDHQSSLGIDITGSLVLVKTIYDMSSILEFLATGQDNDENNNNASNTEDIYHQQQNQNNTTATTEEQTDDSDSKEETQNQDIFKDPFHVKYIDGDVFVLDANSISNF